jgi:hypothetical protein
MAVINDIMLPSEQEEILRIFHDRRNVDQYDAKQYRIGHVEQWQFPISEAIQKTLSSYIKPVYLLVEIGTKMIPPATKLVSGLYFCVIYKNGQIGHEIGSDRMKEFILQCFKDAAFGFINPDPDGSDQRDIQQEQQRWRDIAELGYIRPEHLADIPDPEAERFIRDGRDIRD